MGQWVPRVDQQIGTANPNVVIEHERLRCDELIQGGCGKTSQESQARHSSGVGRPVAEPETTAQPGWCSLYLASVSLWISVFRLPGALLPRLGPRPQARPLKLTPVSTLTIRFRISAITVRRSWIAYLSRPTYRQRINPCYPFASPYLRSTLYRSLCPA